jgi:hypothetical protein
LCRPTHLLSPHLLSPHLLSPRLSSLPFVVPAFVVPAFVVPTIVVPAICCPRHPLSPRSLSPPFVVPAIHRPRIRCPCHSLSLCHPSLSSSLFVVPIIPAIRRFVVLGSIVVSTSISPYEQWLAEGVVVLCDVASAVVVIIVQERARCHPASRGSQRQRRVQASAVVVTVQKQAHCCPASRGSQRQHRACMGYLWGSCVSFGGWTMSLSRSWNLKMKKNI